MEEKKKIAFFLKKGSILTQWAKELKKYYIVNNFFNVSKFLEHLLFFPPDLIIYYYPKAPKQFDEMVKELKSSFNLVKLPIILVFDKIDPVSLEKNIAVTDDFLLINSSVEEVLIRVKYAFARVERISDNNPLTGLPGNTSIERAIYDFMNRKEKYAVCYLDIDNFKPFNDKYGFKAGDLIIKHVGRILINTIKEKVKTGKYFIGHIGGDDFVFIVPFEKVEEICRGILEKFNRTLSTFIEEEDLKRGYFIGKDRLGNIRKIPFPTLSIAIIPVKRGYFEHVGEIAARAAEIKKVLKQKGGNAFLIDRRKPEKSLPLS